MKKTLALFLALVMCFSLFALAGCKKRSDEEENGSKNYKERYGYESYVAQDADIIGSWEEKLSEDSKADKTVWHFEKSTTLNIVETVGDRNITTGCAYNFNEKTNALSYMILSDKKDIKVIVAFDGDTMTFTDESGQVVRTFTKQ